ncbi:MAG: urease accessory protein UreF [Acidimicrobiales bacterium]
MTGAAALLLADGRFPAGGHAHSGGVEAAAHRGRLEGLARLEAFLRGRLATAGTVDAGLAAASCARGRRHHGRDDCGDHRARQQSASGPLGPPPWAELVAEAEARQPSPAQRTAWRAQGRALLRAGMSAWPGPILDGLVAAVPGGAPHPVVMGACAAAANLSPAEAAGCAAYQAVSGPASAAVRLLALDPFVVAGMVATLAPEVDAVADRAASSAGGPLADLACPSAPLLDIGAEDHASWEVRLFAS